MRATGDLQLHLWLIGVSDAAVEAGLRVRYFSAADPVETLYRASRTTQTAASLIPYSASTC
jgi:hypothetical protein